MERSMRIEIGSDRIFTVWLDAPGKSVNTIGTAFLQDLADVLVHIEQEKPAGVIFTSAKAKSFCAGADLFEVRKMSPDELRQFLALGQGLFDRIAHLPMPTVAAINGDCLGGGTELALACLHRVASDHGTMTIGLPEVKIGLIPAWGGSTRLPQLIGLTHALPILLAGNKLPPRKAKKAGLIDEVVRDDVLLTAARRLAKTPAVHHSMTLVDRAARWSPVRSRILEKAKQETLKQTHGNYPAQMALIDVVRDGLEHGPIAGLESERRAAEELAKGPVLRELMRLFFLKQGAKKVAMSHIHGEAAELRYAAVIGGGTMGSGIAHALLRAGLFVRLVEVNAEAASAALQRIQKIFDDDIGSGRMDKLEARKAFNRLSPCLDYSGVEMADIVVEAVAEELKVKREVFSRLDRMVHPHAILASNTSAIPIDQIADATLHPERVIGLHFFNPVPKMPLVEIVRGRRSDDNSLATAVTLSGRIGKTPIVVQDSPGFLVNRILIPYLAEALSVAEEGASIEAVDRALKNWGMPMGPFELLDEIGLDIALHVMEGLGEGGPRAAMLKKAIENKWLGKKSGGGFYLYDGDRRERLGVNEDLVQQKEIDLKDEDLQWRLVLPMVNETAKALSDRVTDSTDTVDIASVFGLGLAPFRGGIAQFATQAGTHELVHRLELLSRKYGERFAPAPLLLELNEHHLPLNRSAEVLSAHTVELK